MANTSYLCSSDLDRIYPSFENDAFRPSTNTVACDVGGVPLLWIAMFRPADVREHTFSVAGQDVTVWAPLTKVEVAVAQLEGALPILAELFEYNGRVDEHAALLRDAVVGVGEAYATLELQEIEELSPPGAFRKSLEGALEFLADPCPWHVSASRRGLFGGYRGVQSRTERARDRLVHISHVLVRSSFPSPSGFWERDRSADEETNLARLLGTSLYRPVPWEPATPV